MVKIVISDEVRDILARGLTKLDDRILEAAIQLSRVDSQDQLVVEPYLVEELIQVAVDAIKQYVRQKQQPA